MPTAVDLKKHTFTSLKFESVIQEAMRFMMASPIHPLPPADRFPGAGVYALYYCGAFEHYRHLAAADPKDAKTPIYVGKAVPPGWRVGRVGRVGPNVRPLCKRLAEHADNINEVDNLEASDFCCRFMILGGTESDLISACEAQLIRQFTPLWNTAVDGFGNHTPGKGRFGQARSEWDVLHRGRAWAKRCRGVPPVLENIIANIVNHRDS
jgi:hypothetical protein